MSKRESKGQRVKTFKAWIPNSDLTKTETQVVVYFKADNGLFYIFDGAHMFAPVRESLGNKYNGDRDTRIHDNMITNNVLDGVIGTFEYICKHYETQMREAQKTKVIRFTFKRNRQWIAEQDEGKNRPGASDISFCGTPAITFSYEVLFRVGDLLYYKNGEDGALQYRGRHDEARGRDGDATTIDWTEEREAFFANMQASLITLICRIEDFHEDLTVNVDRAIAATAQLLLPKPD